jgi:hypothetical protein
VHPKGGVVTLQADIFNRRLYQNKGFVFLGYTNGLAEPETNPVPAYTGPQAKPITDADVHKLTRKATQALERRGASKEEIEHTVKAIEDRLRPREVPTGSTLPGMLAAEGYNRGVPGLDPTMEAPAAGAATEQRAVPGGYVVTVPQPTESNGNGNGEPIEPSQPALPTGRQGRGSSGSSSSGSGASTPAAPEPPKPANA